MHCLKFDILLIINEQFKIMRIQNLNINAHLVPIISSKAGNILPGIHDFQNVAFKSMFFLIFS